MYVLLLRNWNIMLAAAAAAQFYYCCCTYIMYPPVHSKYSYLARMYQVYRAVKQVPVAPGCNPRPGRLTAVRPCAAYTGTAGCGYRCYAAAACCCCTTIASVHRWTAVQSTALLSLLWPRLFMKYRHVSTLYSYELRGTNIHKSRRRGARSPR